MATAVATSALCTASASAGPAWNGARCLQAQQRLMGGNAPRIAAIPMGRSWSRRVKGAVKGNKRQQQKLLVVAAEKQRMASLRGDDGFDPLGLSESVQRSEIESRKEEGVGDGVWGGNAWRIVGMEKRGGWSLESVASSVQKCVFCAALAAAVALPQVMPSSDVFAAPPTGPVVSELAGLIAGPPVKDPDALLRYALPITNKPIKDVQRTLEEITDILKVPGAKAIDPVERAVRQASRLLNVNKDAILVDVSEAKKEEAQQLLVKLGEGLLDFQRILEAKNRAAIAPQQKAVLNIVGDVEEAMVAKFPYDVPSEYAGKPLLKGRASVEMKVKVKDNPNIRDATFEITVDGYNAPVTAGNFIDLVVRRFYDGMEIQRADGFVVQTGDPDGPADGFVDPSTGKIRTIPLEIMVDGDEGPIYGATLEELGRFRERTKLPFNAFGTMAMAREEFEPDTASSQIFWLLKESELTPSNANILDGTFAVFGYVTQNEDLFADLKVGDVIESIKVTNGLDNLVNPSYTIGGA